MTTIDKFSGSHEFLSNFHPSPITIDGLEFPTVEHAFQAAKTHIRTEKQTIAAASTPGKAKRLGRKVQLRPGWEGIKIQIMENLVRQKFEKHPELLQQLKDTGDAQLVEGNTWNDRFWGVCRGTGRNELGKILMRVRDETTS